LIAKPKQGRTGTTRQDEDTQRETGELGQVTEELTPTSGGSIAVLPLTAAAVATLVRPSLWRRFHSGAVDLTRFLKASETSVGVPDGDQLVQ
jgi:hypothetical protein